MPPLDETNIAETRLYDCGNCGEEIAYRLPKGLKGVFTHTDCKKAYEKPGNKDIAVRAEALAHRSNCGDL